MGILAATMILAATRVHFVAHGGEATLEERRGSAWVRLCALPCDADVDSEAVLRVVAGDDVLAVPSIGGAKGVTVDVFPRNAPWRGTGGTTGATLVVVGATLGIGGIVAGAVTAIATMKLQIFPCEGSPSCAEPVTHPSAPEILAGVAVSGFVMWISGLIVLAVTSHPPRVTVGSASPALLTW